LKRPVNIPKLLAPVNSYDGARMVVDAGADEIYLGVTVPGRLKNLWLNRGPPCEVSSYEELRRIISYAHAHDVEVVLTAVFPFMVKSMEDDLRRHLKRCLDEGVDAMIVGDLGIFSLMRSMGVEIPIYASTFMASMNREAVDFLSKLGFSRVILERHLTIDEISSIAKHSHVEIEVFIHGGGCSNINANCYLFHWVLPRLLFTPMRDLTPCRHPFKVYDERGKLLGVFPILDGFTWCSLCRVPQLLQAGVSGFKIVGRCLSGERQAVMTRVYREILDIMAEEGISGKAFRAKLNSLIDGLDRYYIHITGESFRDFYCKQRRCYYIPLLTAQYRYG